MPGHLIPETAQDPVLEELTSESTGAGLEVELPDEDISVSFDPSEIDVVTQARTIDLLLARLREGEMDLSPDFQRRSNLWNRVRKSSLIESLLLRIPIPSLYVSEDKEGNYTVVDGLQRICAIAHFVEPTALNKALKLKLEPLRLEGLQSLNGYDDAAFVDLPRQLQRRISETELTLHVIRASTPQAVKFNIFSRINQGGLPLTSQEIRNAIYPGEWRNRVRRLAESQEFLEATEGKIKGERMEDIELVLRFIAHYTLEPTTDRPDEQNLDTFLNDTVANRSKKWTDAEWSRIESNFNRALLYAPRVFGDIVFRKYSLPGFHRKPINRGLFETECVALARRSVEELDELSKRSTLVIGSFGNMFEEDEHFVRSLLYATGRGRASNIRLQKIDKILDEALNA
ncbi:MAG: DUF262 domain-containing protein [Nitrososphaerales archaeon]|jgi:hypothetical protein